MKNDDIFDPKFIRGVLFASFIFLFTAVTIIFVKVSSSALANFILDHNFDITKYAGTLSYVPDDVNDEYPYVIDTEGSTHVFFAQKGASTHFLTDKHLPKEGTYIQVFEVKIYNSETERLSLLRLIW